MAVTYVQSNHTNFQAPNISTAFSSNVTLGNLLVVGVQDNGTGALGISDTAANTWTAVFTQQDGGGTLQVKMWMAVANATSACTVTVTSGSTLIAMAVTEYNNANTQDQAAGNAPIGSPALSSAITTTQANEVIIMICRSVGGAVTFNAPLTTRELCTFSGTAFFGLADNIVSSIQTGFQGSANVITSGVIVIASFYKPAAAASVRLLTLTGVGQ